MDSKNKLIQSSSQRIVLMLIVILAALVANTFLVFSSTTKISKINKKQIIGIQLADGQMVAAQASEVNDRSDLVITNFVEKWIYLSFNWSTDDIKVEVPKAESEIPGNFYAATFALTTKKDFRNLYIKQFAQLVEKATGKATGKKPSIQSAVRLDYISEKPTKIKEGLWEVIVISTWTGLDSSTGKEAFEVPFSKKLRLKTIPIAGKPTFTNPEDTTQLQSIVNEMNQYGLQIIEIENYDLR